MNTIEPYLDPSTELQEAVLQCQLYEHGHPQYGSLRAVLHEGYAEDITVGLCRLRAHGIRDTEGEHVADMLMGFTPDERVWIFEQLHGL